MKTLLAIIGVLVILACVGGVLVLVIGVAATGSNEAQKVGQVDAPIPDAPAQPVIQAFVVGDIINTSEWGDDWTIIVHSVHYPIGEGWRPKESQRFVMIDLEMINVSDKAQVLSSILAYGLKDAEHHEYDNWITSAAPGESPAGDFAPGEIKRGPVVFQVPEGSDGFVFVFEPSIFGSERVFVTLD